MPSNVLAVWAAKDVAGARSLIPADCLAAFDSVMLDGVSFIESARRIVAQGYSRIGVTRQPQIAREQFVRAAAALTRGLLPRLADIESRRAEQGRIGKECDMTCVYEGPSVY